MIRRTAARLAAFALFALASGLAAAAPSASKPGRVYSALERMKLERLKAAHERVEELKKGLRPVSFRSGFNDYHAILHAHAEDSAHTGGTRPEMLEDAKKTGVDVIMLSDHFRPPRDFIDGSWRGLRDGVLFIPGSETHGFLIYPEKSIMEVMDKSQQEIVRAVTEGKGLIFLSHVESKTKHPMDGLTGMEVYNNHYDAMDDAALLMGVMGMMLDKEKMAALEEGLRLYPAEMYAALVDYPLVYFRKWDAETPKRRVVGVAANDCHHNQVYLVKMVDESTVLVGTIVDDDKDMRTMTADRFPGIREMTAGRKAGDILAKLDLDTYARSYLNCSTHVLAPELTENAIRDALLAGRAYVAHDWMSDPSGFVFGARLPSRPGELLLMGSEAKHEPGAILTAEFPNECEIRLIRDGAEVHRVQGRTFEFKAEAPGVYRLEGWFTIDGEERGWIYSNPVYLR